MKIGNKIRELRKKRGMTQEQLAESIGISFQAVSKWENGIALPDITLAPVLAGYFGVSLDELFDFSLKEMESEVKKICDEACKFRENDYREGRRILEEGLQKYPDNDILLNNLLYVINYTDEPDETIAVASKLIDKTTMNDVKYDAARFLAYAYKAKGDFDSAKAAIDLIPEIYFTKLSEIAFLFSGKEKYDAAEKQKWISFEDMIQMMWKTAEYYEEIGEKEKAADETRKALALVRIMENPAFDDYIDFFEKQINRLTE